MNNNELDSTGWFHLGGRRTCCFWFWSFLFLLIFAMPLIVAFNMALTPCYLIIMVVKCCKIDKNKFKNWWGVILTILISIILYVAVPVTFFLVTIPQIIIFGMKKLVELKHLMKNRCKFYRNLSVSPIINRYFSRIGLEWKILIIISAY